jgi:hypothetical protein
MWLTKFLDIISQFFPLDPLSGKEAALARLDPDKIYIENVRSVLDISQPAAVKICETAVRRGFFQRRVEILCPDGSVAISVSNENDLPPTVRCWTHERQGYEEVMLPTSTLQKIISYRLNAAADTVHA